ncbi:MAG: penicillin acylase family protein [SAR202 cluster bacterium]|nr:penicillin acylase family protein [SAR202 cluster bacterium]
MAKGARVPSTPSPMLTKDDLRRALPDTSSTYRLPGLDGTAEIVRDGYGIPHVRAGTGHDAFFGQGFATAQDRLWHMDYDRRRAYGRWAEFAGKAAVEGDVLMRRLDIAASVRRDYRALNAEAKAMLDAYADGVNAFVKSTRVLPAEYALVGGKPERWRAWDCLAVYKMRHILMGGYEEKLWRARLVNTLGPERAASLYGGYLPGQMVIVPPGAVYDGPLADALETFRALRAEVAWLGGASTPDPQPRGGEGRGLRVEGRTGTESNNWAVSGSRTASGKPLVAGDPHRGLDTPNVYYQVHIACPEFDAIGLSFPGFPGLPHFGHNRYAAWCVTHAMSDYQDLYIERFRAGVQGSGPRVRGSGNGVQSVEYEFKGRWRKARVKHETVKVRGGKDVAVDVVVTHHGPVIVGGPPDGKGIAFKYTATDGANTFAECIPPMLRATGADALEESMRGWVDPCNNFTFADVHGDIRYLNRGRVPMRSVANNWLPVPGWTGEHEWTGFIPFEELPRIKNPPNGYLVTANNKIAGKEYPHHLSWDYAPEYRYRRIYERLGRITRATVADMSSVHAERVSMPAQALVPLLLKTRPADERSRRALEHLRGWDGSMEADSVAPAVYSAFRLKLQERLARRLLGPLADEVLGSGGRAVPGHMRQLEAMFVAKAKAEDTSVLPPGTTWATVLAEALREGAAMLAEKYGEDMKGWTWGKVHYTRPRHTLSDAFPRMAALLDPPTLPMGGDGDTPQNTSFSPREPFVITATSVARYVFDTGDWERSAWVVPLGASGHAGSPHYADQARTWGGVGLVPMTYGWEKVREGAESVQRLERG